ncbi:MAG: tetratricopeptide repeat protein [Silvanigrellales bacterium]|nr:tetratricopeptide repeat protein [Silvanigrellales bacterium]
MDLYERFKIPEPKPFGASTEIYVAEAHNELRLIIQHHLNKLGFQKVRTARDGCVALAELKLKGAGVAIVGDDLTHLGGLDLLKELREDPAVTRECYILLCKPVQKSEIMLAVESGVDDLLIRPVAPADIMPKLRSAYAAYMNPKNPERVYEFAKSSIRTQNLDKAREVYEALTQITVKAARPYVGLARIAHMEGDKAKALEFLNQAIARNSNYVHAFALRAELQVEMGQTQPAVEDFVTAVKLSPLNFARYEKSVEFLLKNQLVTTCIQILEIGLHEGMQHPYVVERLGYCYFMQKDYAKALRFLKQALRLEPENVSFMNSLAICYRDAKQYDDALDTYNQILKRENDNHQVLFNKSLVLLLVQKNEEAAKIFRRCLKIRPDFQRARDKLKEMGVPEDED